MSKYKRGDVREDGKVFWGYRRDRNDKESWILNTTYLNRLEVPTEKRMRRRLSEVKHRSLKNNIPFDLDLEHLCSIFTQTCPALGIELSWNTENKKILKSSASLDRIIPELGYVKGNVRWVSNLANTMKNNATQEELKTFAKWILNDTTN
jgi:hypothetical protein